jgi:hypothetical protein
MDLPGGHFIGFVTGQNRGSAGDGIGDLVAPLQMGGDFRFLDNGQFRNLQDIPCRDPQFASAQVRFIEKELTLVVHALTSSVSYHSCHVFATYHRNILTVLEQTVLFPIACNFAILKSQEKT